MSSLPLSIRSRCGRPRSAMIASSTRVTRRLAKLVSTSSAKHSRVNVSTTPIICSVFSFRFDIFVSLPFVRNHTFFRANLGVQVSPDNRLSLKAQNLAMFCQSAEGVDNTIWLFHLIHADYSSWLKIVIKDVELAQAVAELECRRDVSAAESRLPVFDAIRSRYSLPASEADSYPSILVIRALCRRVPERSAARSNDVDSFWTRACLLTRF